MRAAITPDAEQPHPSAVIAAAATPAISIIYQAIKFLTNI
jgi:hypothetical protein